MGWSFGWNSKAELVNYLIAPEGRSTFRAVEHRVVGNVLWTLEEHLVLKHRTIGCFLLSGRGGEWGYKDMDEGMGPVEVSCPLTLLNKATEPPNEYARAWRERVREHHAAKSARAKFFRSLKVGDRVMMRNRNPAGPFEVTSLKPFRGVHVETGNLYRLTKAAAEAA